MTPLLAVVLVLVVTFATVWLIGTYRSRCLRDPLDEPLSDTRRDGWNTKR